MQASGGRGRWSMALLGPAAAVLIASTASPRADDTAARGVLQRPPYATWETFTTRDGLPSDKVFAVRLDGDRVWAGTSRGLAVYEAGRWRSYGTADGLPHPVVLALDVSPRTGDLWVGTMGGLARFSGGRFDVYTQLNSGLPNDFVNAVRCDPEEDAVWAATAMGAGRLDLRAGSWSIFTHRNTPMHEPWTYSIAIGDGKVYVGSWGGGVIEYTKATGRWREYRDPDREFELDLFPDDGPVNDITAGVDYDAGLLWQVTYTGMTRYDGREWRSYFAADSGLASDFINFVRSRRRIAWVATDQGLSVLDDTGCATYRRREDGRGDVVFYRSGRESGRRITATSLAHNYVLGVDVRDDEVWVATGRGLSRGRPAGPPLVSHDAANAVLAEATGPSGGAAAPGRSAGNGPGPTRYAGTPEPLEPFRRRAPYKRFFTERTAFRGPGRGAPQPTDLDEVRIGFIGPLADRSEPLRPVVPAPSSRDGSKAVFGRRMFMGATLAVEEANAGGGFRGIPFRIVPRSDLVLWGQTSNEMVRFAGEDRVWAILSGIDSNHNHVLSRASIKTEVPILNAGSTDPTLVEHSVPWLVRSINDDRQNAYALLNEIFLVRRLQRVALLRVNDRDGRVGVEEFMQGARRMGHPVVLEMRFENGDTDFLLQLTRIGQSAPDGIVLWGDAEETGTAVRQMRDLNLDIPVFGFDRMARQEFLDAAGDASEGVVVVATFNPDREDAGWRSFQRTYRERWDEEPDTYATHAYDGMNLLVGAIRSAGLNRTLIRDALYDLKVFEGAAGTVRFDTNMNNVEPPWLAEVREGRFHYFAAPRWPEPLKEKEAD